MVDKDLAVLEVEMLADKGRVVSLEETQVVRDLAVSEAEMLVDKVLVVSLEETLVVRDLAALEAETLEDKDRIVLETDLDLETFQLGMAMMVLPKVVTSLLYLVSLEKTIQYYQKYRKHHLLVIRDYLGITLIPKPDVKYSIYVLII